MVSSVPLKWPRVLIYALTSAVAIVGIGASINSFAKGNHDKDVAESVGPLLPIPNVTINVSIHDIIRTGGVLLAGEILTAITGFLSALSVFFSFGRHSRSHLASIIAWTFDLLWLFGSAVATITYGRQRSAKVNAYQNGTKIPDNIVQGLEKQVGLNSSYWSHGYTRFLSIVPWPLILLVAISLALSVIAHRRQKRANLDTPPEKV